MMHALDPAEAIEVLNKIVELELAGAVRYTQYSLHDVAPGTDDSPTRSLPFGPNSAR